MAKKVDIIVGLQWGDEGKGKIVDYMATNYNVVARFQGGPNAGHTLEFDNQKYILHTIPSGIFQPDTFNLIGNGVVIDPIVFKHEVQSLSKHCPWIYENLIISKQAHLILPTHRFLDAAYEQAKGHNKIDSTLKGIGPTYTDKIARQGIRVGDLFQKNFKEKYKELVKHHLALLNLLNYPVQLADAESEWFDACEIFDQFSLSEGNLFIQKALAKNHSILAEGAQGTMLDIDFGSYPFVTSSNTISASACIGLGVSPKQIGDVIGIFKAYCTRVGSGPFPTELNNETGEILRKNGHEYGSTTGRPRRCGWLDLVALNFAIEINGVSRLIITKADVLSTFEKINVATAYKTKEGIIKHPIYWLDDIIEPVYETLTGWKQDITKLTKKEDIPKELLNFLRFIEDYTQTPIEILSVGPDRKQNIVLL